MSCHAIRPVSINHPATVHKSHDRCFPTNLYQLVLDVEELKATIGLLGQEAIQTIANLDSMADKREAECFVFSFSLCMYSLKHIL